MNLTENNGFAGLLKHAADNAKLGGLVGLLIGDSLGVPYEFASPDQLPPRHQIEMQPPSSFRRSHAGVPAGTWSDDGAQALCLLANVLEHCRVALPDFGRRLLKWKDCGYMAVDGDVFDYGVQTADALDRLRDGVPARESGGKGERDNGNGSLMRVMPLALWHTGPDEALVRSAHRQSLPTHAHTRSLVACAFYCLVARAYLQKRANPWSFADQRIEEIYDVWPDLQERKALLAELDVLRRFPDANQPGGTGYVLDSIWSARKAMDESSFEGVARTAILFGNDTDSTCAVACGLAGIRFGLDGIPLRWLQQLRGFEIVEPLIDRLMATPVAPTDDVDDGRSEFAADGTPLLFIDWTDARKRRRGK